MSAKSDNGKVNWIDRTNIFSGFPELGMGIDTDCITRIERVTGSKANQLLRAVKESSMSTYRHITRGLSNKTHNTPKAVVDRKMTEGLLSNSIFREELLAVHARRAFKADKRNPASKIPVIEYVLIEAWCPSVDDLVNGGFAKRYIKQLDATSEDKAIELSSSDSTAADEYFTPMGYQLHAFPTTPTSGEMMRFNREEPWLSEKKFVPYWLNSIVSMAIGDLRLWGTLEDKEKAKLAGAVFGLCSAYRSVKMMAKFLDLEPELATFYEGLTLPSVDLTEEKPEHHDGSLWERISLTEDEAKLSILASEIAHVAGLLPSSMDLTPVALLRDFVDESEQLLIARTENALLQLRGAYDSVLPAIDKMKVVIKNLGSDISLDGLHNYITASIKSLSDPRLLTVGKEQARVLIAFEETMVILEDDVFSIDQRLTDEENNLKEIIESDISAFEKMNQASAIKVKTDEIIKTCVELNEIFTTKEIPKLAETLERRDGEDRSELQVLEGKLLSKVGSIKKLEDKNQELSNVNSGLTIELNKLRVDNSELLTRIENLTHSLSSNGKGKAEALIDDGNLLLAIDALIEERDARSVLKYLEAAYPDRIRVLDSVYDNLESCIPISALYQRTKALICQGLDLMRNSGRLIDIRDVVQGSVSAKESETVRSNRRYRSFRTFMDGNEQRIIYPHLSLGYSHRLYFCFDEAESRMIIGYVGRHLPSAKSSTT